MTTTTSATPTLPSPESFKRRMPLRRRVLIGLVMIAVTFFILELSLGLLDPAGVVFFYDVATLRNTLVSDPSGYIMPPGRVELTHWSYTIDADGFRVVPDADPDGPRVVFTGDSVTFGYGVNDAETWVNLVARELGLNAINAGHISYGMANLDALVSRLPGCMAVLTIFNDVNHIEPLNDALTGAGWMPYTGLYVAWIDYELSGGYTVPAEIQPDAEYAAAAQHIAERPDTLLLSFDDLYGNYVRDRYGAVLVPHYTSQVSIIDPHPDAVGSRQIAQAVIPLLREWMQDRDCTGNE